MKKIKAIIFDLNGIFLSGEPLSQRVEDKFGINKNLFWNEFNEFLKLARTPKERSSDLWQPIADLLNLSIGDFLDFWFSGDTLNLEMLEFAKELKNQGFQIFILSNSLRERIKYYRQHFPEIFNQFDDIYFSCETGFVKPDPKAFENILKINNLNPNECIYFDDSQENVNVASTLGINAKIFENLEKSKEFLSSFSVSPLKI